MSWKPSKAMRRLHRLGRVGELQLAASSRRSAARRLEEVSRPAARPASVGVSCFGPDLLVTGLVESRGKIEILGRVEGHVRGGKVTIAEGGRVEGSVEAESLKICGAIEGPVRANEVEIGSTARVVGNITHLKLSVEAGAYLEGCRPWRPRPLGRKQEQFTFAETD